MLKPNNCSNTRRHFLKLILGGLTLSGISSFATFKWIESSQPKRKTHKKNIATKADDASLITAPEQAINVMDFEAVARNKLPPAHFGYLATGVDDDATLRANRERFEHYQIRPRRLVDVQTPDMSVNLLGTNWDSPIILAPAGSQRAFHPSGEIATASAAREKNHLMILSSDATASIEDVVAARKTPVWFQLYPATQNWDFTRSMIKRVEATGCPVLVLTVDLIGKANRETFKRFALLDTRQCATCHESSANGFLQRKPMFKGFDVTKADDSSATKLSWDFVKRLKETTHMKIVLKGIVTKEDAELAVNYGVDGLIVSNHGGRTEESGRATIDSLPEVLEGTSGKIPVLIDGGFRRGTDIFKALALGATAVCIGRPYLWGLAAFGQSGVESVLDIMRRELQLIMRQAGAASIKQITKEYVVKK